jgi:hypothetical protein
LPHDLPEIYVLKVLPHDLPEVYVLQVLPHDLPEVYVLQVLPHDLPEIYIFNFLKIIYSSLIHNIGHLGLRSFLSFSVLDLLYA